MIGWALDPIDIPTRNIFNSQKFEVGSFSLEHIQVMYKFSPAFKHTYNASFLKKFDEEECPKSINNYADLIKDRWAHPQKFRVDTHGIYATASLDAHMMYVAMMLCRCFGKENSTHFLLLGVPIMHAVA